MHSKNRKFTCEVETVLLPKTQKRKNAKHKN